MCSPLQQSVTSILVGVVVPMLISNKRTALRDTHNLVSPIGVQPSTIILGIRWLFSPSARTTGL